MPILELMLVLLVVVNITLLVVLIGVSEHLGVQFRQFPKPWKGKGEVADGVKGDKSPEVSEVVDELSKNESHRINQIKRDKAMQERLEKIKRELDMTHGTIRKGMPAVEEHPQVKNLPHDAVNVYQDDGEEFAE